MKRSTTRILTTHTGSLPRPWDLVDLLQAKEAGALSDRAAFDSRVREAVAEVVRKQIGVGVDVVSDGEQGKISYSTYVKDRLTGFDGESLTPPFPTWQDYPEANARRGPPTTLVMPACNGPIARRDDGDLQTEIGNLKAAVSDVTPSEVFMTAASPGVIAFFLRNDYYPTRDEYLAALGEAMKDEYEAIHQAGFLLQVDCPDLAMGRHLQFPDLSTEEFLKIAEANVEVLNHALTNIHPDRVRLHLCWGNYQGPHDRDIALKDIIGVALKAKPSAISFEGANPRHEHEWKVFEEVKLPDGKLIIPGVIDSTTNFIEHPELVAQRIVRYAQSVGKENVLAGSDCGFGTSVRSDPLIEPEVVWPKLQAMTAGAQLASQELW